MTSLTPRLRAGFAAVLALLTLPAAPALAATAPAANAPATTKAHPALWLVSEGNTRIYLFGTVHALPKGTQWLDGPLAGAFAGSDELVTEIIEKSPEDMRAILTKTAYLPEGQSLRELMPAANRAHFEKAMTGNGLPVSAFDRFQPWYAAVALSTVPVLKAGYDPANGVDAQLMAKADADHRAHSALETPEFQLGLFAALPQAAQLRYLDEVARNSGSIRKDLAAMIAAWSAGDAPRLARIMNADEDDPELTTLLLINRNKSWAQWIKARMGKPGTVFIAVGAGHLAGPGSLQDQLKALGLTARRVQ